MILVETGERSLDLGIERETEGREIKRGIDRKAENWKNIARTKAVKKGKDQC